MSRRATSRLPVAQVEAHQDAYGHLSVAGNVNKSVERLCPIYWIIRLFSYELVSNCEVEHLNHL